MDIAKIPRGGLSPVKAGTRASGFLIVTLVLIGMLLRVVPLQRDPLHQDEALYGFWARLISTLRDPGLTTVPIDKPPLLPYLVAGSQAGFGVSEFSIRMPGLAASLLSIPLIYTLARRLYGDQITSVAAAAMMALTPFPVLFGATAFTDPILVGWWLAACCAALSGRWAWAGFLQGLAFASKQQAVILAPLVVWLGLIRLDTARTRWSLAVARFALGMAPVVGAVFTWDHLRRIGGAATGFWTQGVESFGGLRLIWSNESIPRLEAWSRLGRLFLGWPWLSGLALVGLGGLLWHDLQRRRRTDPALVDLTLATVALSYTLLHWIVAFPVWDRYLLPLIPLLGLLLGRAATLFLRATRHGYGRRRDVPSASEMICLALLVLVLLGTGLVAASGRIPVGGDHGAYDGLAEVAAFLRTLPVGTVLYDRWLSWHFDFYLFDAYLYRAGFPSPDWLAADAAAFYNGHPRYLVLPDWESAARIERALARVGFVMSPVLRTQRRNGTPSFVVYEIGPVDDE